MRNRIQFQPIPGDSMYGSIEFGIAFRALARHKLRSCLAMLGISIGVGAYICSVSVGKGAAAQVQEQLAGLGENLIQIEAGGRAVNGVRTGNLGTNSLLPGDLKAIQQHVPLITKASANVDTHAQVIRGNQNWRTQVRGISPDFLAIRKWTVERGACFTPEDVDWASKVCLLGQTVATQLFGDEDPVGQVIQVQKLPCRVVGVLGLKGASSWGQDLDDIVLMPYTTVQKKIMGIYWLDDIFCSAVSMESMRAAEEQVGALLRERHHIAPGRPDDFNLRHPTAVLQAREESQQVMTVLLASIASVALLVGGIGIMNIMLASVTERTREIGIRMAVGADERDILAQFLVESVTLSLVGAAVGIALGLGASFALAYFAKWRTMIEPGAVLVAIGFAIVVGIFFGSYPAMRASRLDPVEALGH
jgi:putative ABC transport system permease protein